MGRDVYFLFYFLYLIGAQFLLFLLMIVRNIDNNNVNIFMYMFLASLIILIIMLAFVRIRMATNSKPKSNILINSENLASTTMSEFLSFFLLPFFTFNLITTNSISQQLYEMLFIFILLTIFLHRSENLLINPLIFVFFNLYKGASPGSNYNVIMPKHRTSASVEALNKENFVRITNKILVFYSNPSDYKSINNFLNLTTVILIVITICLGFFVLDIPFLKGVTEKITDTT